MKVKRRERAERRGPQCLGVEVRRGERERQAGGKGGRDDRPGQEEAMKMRRGVQRVRKRGERSEWRGELAG